MENTIAKPPNKKRGTINKYSNETEDERAYRLYYHRQYYINKQKSNIKEKGITLPKFHCDECNKDICIFTKTAHYNTSKHKMNEKIKLLENKIVNQTI